MVKCEVIGEFTLQRYDELKNIVRVGKEEKGRLFVRDTFECTEEMAEYLTGNNPLKIAVVKIIEIIPEEVSEEVVQAVANAIVEEADEQGKEIKEVVEEIVEESKEEKKTTKRKPSTKKTIKNK